MALDASIYSQIQQPQQPNPLASLAQAYQIKGYQSQMDKADRAEQQQNRLMSVLQSPEFQQGDAATRARLAYGAGDVDAASKITSTAATANKDQRAADVSQLDLKIKQLDAAANIAGTVSDQASYDRALPMMRDLGFDISKFSPQYNPDGVRQFAMATLSAKDRLAAQTQARGQDITMRGQDMTQSTALRGQDLTRDTALRGQDLTDARSREANQNGRVPTGYRQTADGTLEFIPGGPADPSAAKKAAPTEFQGKSAIFGARAQEADRILSGLGADFSPAAINAKNAVSGTPLIGGALEAGANVMLSDGSQKAEQAQRDFINAVLRLESGAAIGKDEFTNAKKQYFPQPGDSAEVIAQKASNRKLQIQGLLGNAGNAPIPQTGGARPAGVPKNKPATGVMSVATAEDYAKVPSGATYTTPDGKMRRKP
jgi:hypothetical protein